MPMDSSTKRPRNVNAGIIERLVRGLAALSLAAWAAPAAAQLQNDYCSFAFSANNDYVICIPQGGSATVLGTNVTQNTAPDAIITSCTGINDHSDVWYRYTASASGPLTVSMCKGTQGIQGVLSLHSACPNAGGPNVITCGTAGCTNGQPTVGTFVSTGQTVYVRVASSANSPQGSFTLTVDGPVCPVNDECATATAISLGSFSGPGFSTFGATPGGGCGSTGSTPDVWYKYTAAASGNLTVNTCGTSSWDTALTVYSGCPATSGNQVACNDNCVTNTNTCSGGGPGTCGVYAACVTVAVAGNTTYWIRVAGHDPQDSGNFFLSLCFTANDLCAAAADICPSPATGSITVSGNNSAASTDGSVNTLCAASTSKDVWYKYTPAETGYMTATTCGSTSIDSVLSLHYAPCPGNASDQLACLNDQGGTCGNDATINAEVVGGITYLIRVASLGSTAGGAFALTLTGPPCGPPGPPPNDECANAQVLCTGTTAPFYVVGDNSLATNSAGASSSCSAVGRDVWYHYVPATSGMLNMQTCSYSTVDTVLSVHTGCPGTTANQVAGACNDDGCGDQSSLNLSVIAGTNYWIRVGSAGGAAGGPFILYTLAPSCQQTPLNDLCPSAEVITGTSGSLSGTTAFATSDGSVSCPSLGGPGNFPFDVWYSYTPPSCGTLRVDTCGPNLDTTLSVHSGTCPGTASSQLACNENCADASFPCSGTTLSCLSVPVQAGVPYLIRVATGSPGTGTFYLDWALWSLNAPVNMQANPSNLCGGGSSTLSATVQAGETVDWFTGGCGTTLVGSGTSLVVSPTVQTTYYARARNLTTGCANGACNSVQIAAGPIPPAPATPTASPPAITAGQSSTLTIPNPSPGFTFEWYTGSCGGPLVGLGPSITVTPAVTTTYYAAQIDSVSGCLSPTCSNVTVTVNSSVTIVSANPPNYNPYSLVLGAPFLDVLDTGSTTSLTAGVGGTGTAPQGGVQYAPISVTFSGPPSPPPTPANISVSCTGGVPLYVCPTVTTVSGGGSSYTVSLSGVIPPLQCTTLTFAGTAPGVKLQYQSQPGNVSMNAAANAQDLLTLIAAIQNGSASSPGNVARYNLNRSTGPNPVDSQDLLRLVQLLNGVNTTQSFNGAPLAPCP